MTFSSDGSKHFDQRLIYPENDWRAEYRGDTKDNCVPHGKGILLAKNGEEFKGEWVDGTSKEHATTILGFDTNINEEETKE